MRASLFVPTARLRQFQELVKQHNLRFVGNPVLLNATAHVCVDAEHLGPGGANAFWEDWHRLNQQIGEKVTPRWKQCLRRVGLWK